MKKNYSVLQIVGYQNSGKTTLTEKLIKKAKNKGLLAATIKHHGHGGAPDLELTSKDSVRHLNSGAIVSSVEGDGVLQLRTNLINWDLKKTLELYRFFSMDIIFIEGYKRENYSKVVLIRDEGDLHLLDSLTNISCVISHVVIEESRLKEYQYFHLSDEENYIEFLMKGILIGNFIDG
ncbi:molybdopterin-guanine dinucleotide biosynthesis protein B [Bacillus sp. AFS017336]|uniref:molybdopterin-guanine dinucleotide biosynthesis protein B n=1 Tax=Bacillus sp. AFS017336 TaxID=2033489 RepID=UPI000BF1004B|nr:molybdopterin-guanine dinucleotide biosynthesis protein B [Bacillus sp. AFS017336]PEK99747.1 molybdopterin-guanine dinucleotide biosynthesis protein B [Bacillus sp. AFS017336]